MADSPLDISVSLLAVVVIEACGSATRFVTFGRVHPSPAEAIRLHVADLELDVVRREAHRGSRELSLSPQEFVLLEYLCRNAGRVVTRTMILDHVWKMRFDPGTNVVDVHIHRLRTKVDRDVERPLIHTVRGIGYVLKDS